MTQEYQNGNYDSTREEAKNLLIFCSKLSSWIEKFDQTPLPYPEIYEQLSELKEILDASADGGVEPRNLLASLSPFCKRNLEPFLYDYIALLIEKKKETAAAELIEGFWPYIRDRRWFELAQAKAISHKDPREASKIIEKLLGVLEESTNLDLLFEVSAFLISHANPKLFRQAIHLITKKIETEEDFQELLAITAHYFSCSDMEEEAEKLKKLFSSRLSLSGSAPLSKQDPAFLTFSTILGSTLA